MRALLRLVAMTMAVSTAKRRARRAVRHGAMLLVVAATVSIGLAFLSAALWIWIAGQTTPLTASLVLGGLFLVAAVVAYITAALTDRAEEQTALRVGPMTGNASQIRTITETVPPSLGNLVVVLGTGYLLGRVVANR